MLVDTKPLSEIEFGIKEVALQKYYREHEGKWAFPHSCLGKNALITTILKAESRPV